MADNLSFLLDKSVAHLDKGLEMQRQGNLPEARYNLLKAAEFLFKAAEKTSPPLKEKRVERAQALLAQAAALEKPGKSAAASGPKTAGKAAETATADASEWLVREKPDVRLADVAGLGEAKEQILIKMVYPFTHPELAKKYGIKKGGGLLLYGPPGTGKTMIAKAVAGEIDAAFYTVKPSEVMSKWVGEAEQNVARLFDSARKQPRAVIFLDEVEALAPRRSQNISTVMARLVPQILSELEGFDSKADKPNTLLFIGATNEPWSLDEAILRPGRLDEKLYIPLPDEKARKQILQSNLKGKPLSPELNLDEVARMTEGYSGADLRRLCEKASDAPFLESIQTGQERPIEMRDILTVLHALKPSVSQKNLARFERFAAQGG
ncbi:MAG: ATP-binding protein [Chloroflexi bacterium]|nr:ATP-binding protein [Chloroflexota bacterium]